ncbi:Rv3235 family protein [Saccharothrix syringae]|uniref:Rv3235 family protein n=1 Tax=Saccharothrix syringae TaxID=103733 RepID=UPI001D173117|nr:Rv3235 family protein [Saccharothrix syringae]
MPPQLRTLPPSWAPGTATTAQGPSPSSPTAPGSPVPAPRPPTAPDARHFLIPALETLCGRRPASQLAKTFAPPAVTALSQAVTRNRTRLGRYRLCQVSSDAAELAGTLHMPTRTRAFAARVERHGDRWQCTEFHLLP